MGMKFNPLTGNFDIDSNHSLTFLDARYLNESSNLSDLDSVSDARDNLGLGTMALEDASDYIPTSDYADFVNVTGDTMTGNLLMDNARIRANDDGFQVPLIGTRIDGDSEDRIWLDNWGIINWGDGSGGALTRLYRIGTGLETPGSITILGGFAAFAPNGTTNVFAGNQFFNGSSLKHQFSLFTGNNNFFLDSINSNDPTVTITVFRTNADDEDWVFYPEYAGGNVGIGVGLGSTAGKLHIDQNDASGARPVLYLDQADVSEEIFEIVSTEGAGNAISDYSSLTLTGEELIKITVNGATRYLVAYSGA